GRNSPECPGDACANRCGYLAKRNTPFSSSESTRCTGVPMTVVRCHSLLQQILPCSGAKKSLFPKEQGIGCKPLNPLGEPLQNRPKRPETAEIFNSSLLISLFSGNSPQQPRTALRRCALFLLVFGSVARSGGWGDNSTVCAVKKDPTLPSPK